MKEGHRREIPVNGSVSLIHCSLFVRTQNVAIDKIWQITQQYNDVRYDRSLVADKKKTPPTWVWSNVNRFWFCIALVFFFPFLFLFSSFFNAFVFLSNFQTRAKFEDCWAVRREIWQASRTHRRWRFPSVVLIVIYTWLYILDKKNFESRILNESVARETASPIFFLFYYVYRNVLHMYIMMILSLHKHREIVEDRRIVFFFPFSSFR